MKIENRLVYIAEDGKEFDSEDACLNYERSCKLSDYLTKLIYNNTPDLNRDDSEEVAIIVAENITTILDVYSKL